MKAFQEKKIYVAGHAGLVGKALVRCLEAKGYVNLILKTRQELNLLDAQEVRGFFEKERPHIVIDAAAKVGGILANDTYRADFIYENLTIQNHVLWGAHEYGAEMCIFLGSSCVYPRDCPQPIKEEYLLSGQLESTNRPYAVAKIAGLELIHSLRKQYGRNYFSVMPTNLYGPDDNFNPDTSHVIPGLIRRFSEAVRTNAPEITIWGTGKPLREFMHADDCADAIVFLMENVHKRGVDACFGEELSHINIGTGEELSISELARLVADVTSYRGEVLLDAAKPDGTPRKRLDTTRLSHLGWAHKIPLREGLEAVSEWFIAKTSFRG